LRARDERGIGQVADVAITETLIGVLGAQLSVFAATGRKPSRLGNGSDNSAPRGVYRCRDGRWVAVSASAGTVADRVIRLVGRPDLAEQPWYSSGEGRAAHRDEIDDAVARSVGARDRPDVLAEFERAQAVVAPIYDVADVLADPHFCARGVTVEVADSEGGSVRMPGLPFRLSATPGRIRHAGPALGAHTAQVLGEGRR